MNEVTGVGDDRLAQPFRKERLHALHQLDSRTAVAGAVEVQRRHLDRGHGDALLDLAELGNLVHRVESAAVVSQRRLQDSGRPEGLLERLHFIRLVVPARRPVAPEPLDEGVVTVRDGDVGEWVLEEEHVPGAALLIVVGHERLDEGWPVRHRCGDELGDALGGDDGRSVRGERAPIVAEQDGGIVPEGPDELDGIAGQ